jgi:hypothetical protein
MAVLSFGSPHGYAWGGSILSAGAALIPQPSRTVDSGTKADFGLRSHY